MKTCREKERGRERARELEIAAGADGDNVYPAGQVSSTRGAYVRFLLYSVICNKWPFNMDIFIFPGRPSHSITIKLSAKIYVSP